MGERNEYTSPFAGFVDYNNILRDVAREWMTVLIITICSGLIAYMVTVSMYEPVYRTKTTMVVTATGTYNDMYNNLRSASGSQGNGAGILLGNRQG